MRKLSLILDKTNGNYFMVRADKDFMNKISLIVKNYIKLRDFKKFKKISIRKKAKKIDLITYVFLFSV
jgi:hypothetical protein